MSKRSPETRLDSVSVQRRRQLRRASDRLAVVLQSLDLETETQLANEVVEAIKATDRAYELEAGGPRTAARSRSTDDEFPDPDETAVGRRR